MDLKAQIQLLIDNAPKDGVTPKLVAAIAPALSAIASSLRHSQYYILQSLDEEWVVTTISNRGNPQVEKQVIYAFPTLQDIGPSYSAGLDPQVIAAPIPVTHILFQLLALEPVDSIVFFDTAGVNSNEIEIKRIDLQNLIQQQLQKNPPSFKGDVPPDIA